MCARCKLHEVVEQSELCQTCLDDDYNKYRVAHEVARIIPARYQHAQMEALPSELSEILLALGTGRGAYLHGSVGFGKTFAMYAYVRFCIEQRFSVYVCSYDELCINIRASFNDDSIDDEGTLINKCVAADVLCLDDVGVSKRNEESEFSTRILRTILNKRYNDMSRTIITSNKSLVDLEFVFDERIVSRIRGCCVSVLMNGKDKRLL